MVTWLTRWLNALMGLHRHACRCGGFYLCSRVIGCPSYTCEICEARVLAAWGLEFEARQRRRQLNQIIQKEMFRGEL